MYTTAVSQLDYDTYTITNVKYKIGVTIILCYVRFCGGFWIGITVDQLYNVYVEQNRFSLRKR